MIEDGAQSFGAQQHGRRSCNLSTVGTTSLFPSKPLGGYGDGGACFTNDAELPSLVWRISRHGQSRRYFHTEVGVNGRIDTIQAAILLVNLEQFDAEAASRQQIGECYSQCFQVAGIAKTPFLAPGKTSVYAQYTIEVENLAAVQKALSASGTPTAVHYLTLLCQQPALQGCVNRCRAGCATPLEQRASERVMSLPMHPYLSPQDQDDVVAAVTAALC